MAVEEVDGLVRYTMEDAQKVFESLAFQLWSTTGDSGDGQDKGDKKKKKDKEKTRPRTFDEVWEIMRKKTKELEKKYPKKKDKPNENHHIEAQYLGNPKSGPLSNIPAP